jgi:uncharacterized membrane protein YoaK (UPF0700 family)
VALGYDAGGLSPASRLFTLIGLTALTTTVLTLTLTGLAADSSLSGGENRNWCRRVAAVVATFVGAVVGAVLVRTSGLVVPLVITGAVVLGVTLAYAAHPASRASAGEPDGP